MPRLIISTDNMRFYYEAARYLKEEGQPFMSVRIGEPLPERNTVVITTEEEAGQIEHPRICSSENPVTAARMAIQALKTERRYGEVVMGIDPGKAIGMAVVGDGGVLWASVLSSLEEVREEVLFCTESCAAERFLIRIGDGDQTMRDRIISALWPLGMEMEMVREQDVKKEERRAEAFARRKKDLSDIAAAIGISMMQGERIGEKPDIRPSRGEIREIQRRSRIRSDGRITISRGLARRVAKGEMEMDRAIEEQGSER